MDQVVEKKGIGSWFHFDVLPRTLISVLVVLVPFFFIPSSYVSLQVGKSTLIFSFTILAFCMYLISVLKKGSVRVTTSKISIAILSILLATLVAAVVSKIPSVSFFGYGFEVGTFTSVLLFWVVAFLTSTLFVREQQIVNAYLLFFVPVTLLTAFHVLRFVFGADLFSFGVFNTMASTPVGEWYDLGIIYGAALLLSLITIELVPLQRAHKIFLYAISIVALVFLAVIHFSLLWLVLLCFSVVFFVYTFSFNRAAIVEKKPVAVEGEVVHTINRVTHRKISVNTLIVLIVSLVFLLPLGGVLSETLATKSGVVNIAVRPSWVATTQIAQDALAVNPLFGVGPNRFAYQWNMSKPTDINTTPFWNVTFTTGVGYVPSFLVTTGIVGFLAWLTFLVLFLYLGFSTLFTRTDGVMARYLAASSFFTALYFWVIATIYIPGPAILVLTFFFTGLFFAVAYMQGVLRVRTIVFSAFPKISFACVLGLVFLLVVGFGFMYALAQKTVSAYFFERAVHSMRVGSADAAEQHLTRAISLSAHDVYYRERSTLQIQRLAGLVASVTQDTVTDEVRTEFQRILGNAIADADFAVAYNSEDFENWVARGRVYEAVMPLGVDRAYEEAKRSYEEAQKRSPKNPALFFVLARLEASKGDYVRAKEYLAQAIAQKANYSDAIFLKSKIEVAQGDIRGAIASVEKITFIAPNDTGIFFELGLLKYNNKDYLGASKAFERAVTLIPDYSNAKYFLGLSYQKLGRQADSIAQFEDILKLNPGNSEITLILSNLRAGRAPFTNAEPEFDDAPEKRDELPLDEDEE